MLGRGRKKSRILQGSLGKLVKGKKTRSEEQVLNKNSEFDTKIVHLAKKIYVLIIFLSDKTMGFFDKLKKDLKFSKAGKGHSLSDNSSQAKSLPTSSTRVIETTGADIFIFQFSGTWTKTNYMAMVETILYWENKPG